MIVEAPMGKLEGEAGRDVDTATIVAAGCRAVLPLFHHGTYKGCLVLAVLATKPCSPPRPFLPPHITLA